MQIRAAFVLAMVSGFTLCAQTQSAPAPQTPQSDSPAPAAQPAKPPVAQAPARPRVLKPQAYVRRFSLVATMSITGLRPIVTKTAYSTTTTPPVSKSASSADATYRIGYGAEGQVLITDRFALNVGVFRRQLSYKTNTAVVSGTDNPETIEDERVYTGDFEDTRARFIDFPVVIRYYAKDRFRRGPRVFFEAGGTLRRVSHIHTQREHTDADFNTTCCTYTPAVATHSSVKGITAGMGVQIVDPVGIRIIPEVRYTRWLQQVFNNFSTVSRKDQVEAMISIGF